MNVTKNDLNNLKDYLYNIIKENEDDIRKILIKTSFNHPYTDIKVLNDIDLFDTIRFNIIFEEENMGNYRYNFKIIKNKETNLFYNSYNNLAIIFNMENGYLNLFKKRTLYKIGIVKYLSNHKYYDLIKNKRIEIKTMNDEYVKTMINNNLEFNNLKIVDRMCKFADEYFKEKRSN